jgi:hypothetical protein
MKHRAIKWTAVNSLFAAALYFAFVENVQGAQNIVQFYVWFAFIISLLSVVPAVWQKMAENPDGLTPQAWRVVDVIYDTAVVIILVWVGWMWMAALYLIHIFFIQGAITQAKQHVFELLKETQQA